jgi:hypothetical protein
MGITDAYRSNFLTLQVLCDLGDVSIMPKEERTRRQSRCINDLGDRYEKYDIQTYLMFDAITKLHCFVSVKTFDEDKFEVAHELMKTYGNGTVVKTERGHETLFIDQVYKLPTGE